MMAPGAVEVVDPFFVGMLTSLAGYVAILRWYIRPLIFLGIVAHELSHYCMALIFRGYPELPCISYRQMNGHVTVRRMTPWNAVPIAFSPFLLPILAAILLAGIANWYDMAWRATLAAVLMSGGIPSFQDVKVTLRALFRGGLRWLVLVLVVWFFLRQYAL